MKKKIVCVLSSVAAMVMFSGVVIAENCSSLSGDDKYYCNAKKENDSNICNSIGDHDTKHECRAVVEKDKNICNSISDSSKKSACKALF